MSFFKDFKEDLSQAVTELLPGEEVPNAAQQPEMVVNTLEQEVDAKAEMEKMSGLLERMPASQEARGKDAGAAAADSNNEIKVELVSAQEQPHKEETVVSTENSKENANAAEGTEAGAEASSTLGISEEVSDEVTVITEGTILKGDLEATGSFELRGRLEGNVHCNGKMTITGSMKGNAKSSEFFADAAKVEGEIDSSGTVKIGLGSIVVGDITATSAVIAGAIKGDIDVQGPVVVDTSAVVVGNIKSRSVQINNGAVIEGFCSQCYADVDMDSFFAKQ